MRWDSVVVLEPGRQLPHDGLGIAQIGSSDVIPLDRVDEGLGHAVGFRAVSRCGDGLEAQLARVADGLERRVGTAVVREPFDR